MCLQEVNQGAGLAGAFDGSIGGETIVSDDLVTIHPALTEAVMTKSPADTCKHCLFIINLSHRVDRLFLCSHYSRHIHFNWYL